MHKILSIVIALVFSFACTNTKHTEEIIDQEKMVAILYDLSILDGVVTTHSDFSSRSYVKQSFYDTVFTKHKITEKQFKWNVLYYTETRELPAIYEKVISHLNDQRTVLEKNRMDSLMPKKDSIPVKK